jgi:hypothetical protein
VAIADMINLDNDSTSAEELWNWVKKVCQHGLHECSKRLHAHKEQLLKSSKIQIQQMDKDNSSGSKNAMIPQFQGIRDKQKPTTC